MYITSNTPIPVKRTLKKLGEDLRGRSARDRSEDAREHVVLESHRPDLVRLPMLPDLMNRHEWHAVPPFIERATRVQAVCRGLRPQDRGVAAPARATRSAFFLKIASR